MGKLLLWVVIVLVVMMVARMISANKLRDSASPDRQRGRPAKQPPPRVEHMVRCSQCGIHLPRSEALLSGGHTYCSPEHARLGVSQEHD